MRENGRRQPGTPALALMALWEQKGGTHPISSRTRAWKRLAPERITRSSMPCLFLDQFSLVPSLGESDGVNAHSVLTKATALLQEAIRAREMLRRGFYEQGISYPDCGKGAYASHRWDAHGGPHACRRQRGERPTKR